MDGWMDESMNEQMTPSTSTESRALRITHLSETPGPRGNYHPTLPTYTVPITPPYLRETEARHHVETCPSSPTSGWQSKDLHPGQSVRILRCTIVQVPGRGQGKEGRKGGREGGKQKSSFEYMNWKSNLCLCWAGTGLWSTPWPHSGTQEMLCAPSSSPPPEDHT